MHQFSSVQFSRSVMSNSLRLHGLQHTRLPCPSPTHEVYSDSCPLSQWCHPTISSSVIPFSSLQSCPVSGLLMNIQDWFPSGLTDLISLQSKGLSRVFSNTTASMIDSKASILRCSAFFTVQLSHPYMTTGKTIALTVWTFDGKMVSLHLKMLSRFVIAFLPRRKRLLIFYLFSYNLRGEGYDRGWDGWMASPTRWTWVWVDSGSWWWTGRPGTL